MAGSPVTIANNALALVAADPIQAMDERTRVAALCNTFYPQAFREALEVFDFPETKTTSFLATVPGALVGPWSGRWAYAYTLPADFIKARFIWTADPRYPQPYELSLSGDLTSNRLYLYTNCAPCALVYTTSRVDVSQTSAEFDRVVEFNLAKRISGPLKKRMEPRSELVKEYTRAIEAIKANLANTEPEVLDMDFIPLAIQEQFS